MATERRGFFALLVFALCLGAGCANSGGANDSSGAAPASPGNSGSSAAGSGFTNEGPSSDAGAPLPPEKELDQSFRAPVATGRVLWSANPDSGRVALIDAKTLAVLYANAVPSSHLTLLDAAHGQFRTVDLQGAVESVYVAPDSKAAITFQTPPAGSKKRGLFSIVPTDSVRSPRIVGTDAAPAEIAFSEPALGKALITVHDSSSTVHGVYVVGLANLEQNFVSLSSEPLPGATGIVSLARRGFVAQKHPEGRITFIDLDTGAAQTLSGFEIAARIVQ